MKPSPGTFERVGSNVRIVGVLDGERELYGVEVQFGGDGSRECWMAHQAPCESYITAMRIARKVARRQREARDDRSVEPEYFGFRPDNDSEWRPDQRYYREDVPTLAARIRRAAKARGLRWYDKV